MYERFRNLVAEILSRDGLLSISCIVGAGLSAGSGLQTFRGENGLYSQIEPEALASRQGFEANPELVWSWYRDRMIKVMQTEPNPGHYALVELEHLGVLHKIITQNVDGLHRRAGQSDDKLIQVHGTLSETHCLNHCGKTMQITTEDDIPDSVPVHCSCGSYQRPSVVWFGEPIPFDFYAIINDIKANTNLLLIIGTSGTVVPVSMIPGQVASVMEIVNINPDISSFKHIADQSISEPAEAALPKIVTIIKNLLVDQT